MAALDTLVDVALDLIDRMGNLAVFTVPQAGVYDPATMKTTFPGEDAYERRTSPPFPFNRERSLLATDIKSDLTTYVAAKDLPFTVATGIRVAFGSQEYECGAYAPIYSGDEIAVYELGLSK